MASCHRPAMCDIFASDAACDTRHSRQTLRMYSRQPSSVARVGESWAPLDRVSAQRIAAVIRRTGGLHEAARHQVAQVARRCVWRHTKRHGIISRMPCPASFFSARAAFFFS